MSLENWIFYGLAAAVCFGINTVLYKISVTKGSGLNPFIAILSVAAGIFLFFLIASIKHLPSFNSNWQNVAIAFASGIIWAAGMLMIVLAISHNVPIAKLAPLFNTNTIITVCLGLFLLKEIPSAAGVVKVIAGTILIVAGAIVVSL